MPTAICKYIFQPFTVYFMILKNKNTCFIFPRLCFVSLIQIYHRTSSIALVCLLLVLTVIKTFLTLAGEQYACLPYIHKTHGRLLLVSFT